MSRVPWTPNIALPHVVCRSGHQELQIHDDTVENLHSASEGEHQMSLPSQQFWIGLQELYINGSRVAENVRPSRVDHQSVHDTRI